MKGKTDTKKIVAFDFASTGIRAVAAEVMEDNSVRILSEESRKAEGVKHGIIGQPSGTAFSISALWKELQNSAELKDTVKSFSTSFGGRSMSIVRATVEKKLSKHKAITEDQIDAMALECEQSYQKEGMLVYDTIPVMYELDGKVLEKPEGLKGNRIVGTYHLVVGNELMKTQLDKCMERIYNCSIEFMPLAADAFSIAVTDEPERKEGCAVINLGDTSTTLAIYQNEILQQLLVVPLGGRNITHDIEEIGISEAHAEKLKCLKGTAKQEYIDKAVNIKIPSREPDAEPVVVQNTFLAMVIEARLDEMFQPIFEMLQQHAHDLPHGIILTGGGASLNKICEYINENTGIATRYGDHTDWLTPDTPQKYGAFEYSQLIGTILLTQSNREDKKPVETETEGSKKKSPKRKSLREFFTQGFIDFFEDDTDLSQGNR